MGSVREEGEGRWPEIVIFKYQLSFLTLNFNFPRNLKAYFLPRHYSPKATHQTTGWDQHTLAVFIINVFISAQCYWWMPTFSVLIPHPGLYTLTSCHHSPDPALWLSWFPVKSLPKGKSFPESWLSFTPHLSYFVELLSPLICMVLVL